MNSTLLLKDQAQCILNGWKVTEPIPGKGKAVIVGFPPTFQFPIARLTYTDQKSTYGKRLYRLQFFKSLSEMQPCPAP